MTPYDIGRLEGQGVHFEYKSETNLRIDPESGIGNDPANRCLDGYSDGCNCQSVENVRS